MTGQGTAGPQPHVVGRQPDVAIVGAPRCATTSLYTYLASGSSAVGVGKDTYPLVDRRSGQYDPRSNIHTLGALAYEYPVPSHSVVVEATALHLYQETALEVLSSSTSVRAVVVVLRDPIDRLASVYRYFAMNQAVLPAEMSADAYAETLLGGGWIDDDETVGDALRQGRYKRWLERWAAGCGTDRLHVFGYEEVIARPHDVLGRILPDRAHEWPAVELQYLNAAVPLRSRGIHTVARAASRYVPGPLRSRLGRAYRRLNNVSATDRSGEKTTVAGHETFSLAMVDRLREYYGADVAALQRSWGPFAWRNFLEPGA